MSNTDIWTDDSTTLPRRCSVVLDGEMTMKTEDGERLVRRRRWQTGGRLWFIYDVPRPADG